MNIKRVVSSIAIAGLIAASTLGIGTGIATASTEPSNAGTATVQPVGWHGGGHDFGHGGRGWGNGYGGGWHGDPFWHLWGWHR
jgi:hypothetical protein